MEDGLSRCVSIKRLWYEGGKPILGNLSNIRRFLISEVHPNVGDYNTPTHFEDAVKSRGLINYSYLNHSQNGAQTFFACVDFFENQQVFIKKPKKNILFV